MIDYEQAADLVRQRLPEDVKTKLNCLVFEYKDNIDNEIRHMYEVARDPLRTVVETIVDVLEEYDKNTFNKYYEYDTEHITWVFWYVVDEHRTFDIYDDDDPGGYDESDYDCDTVFDYFNKLVNWLYYA